MLGGAEIRTRKLQGKEKVFAGVRTGPPELTPISAESLFGVRTGSQASEIGPSRWTCRSQAFARVRRRPICVAPHLAPQSHSSHGVVILEVRNCEVMKSTENGDRRPTADGDSAPQFRRVRRHSGHLLLAEMLELLSGTIQWWTKPAISRASENGSKLLTEQKK